MTQEYTPSFLKAGERKQGEVARSAQINNVNEKIEDRSHGARTPVKYQCFQEASGAKGSGLRKSPPKEEMKLFTCLNEIMESKNREKLGRQLVEASRSCKQSKMIGEFELGKQLGKGKFGEVYLVRHHESGFVAALKKI